MMEFFIKFIANKKQTKYTMIRELIELVIIMTA